MELLKSCPFCGGDAYISDQMNQGKQFGVNCLRCWATLPPFFGSKESAAAAWNRRTPDSAAAKGGEF
jgi:Lar family restriction alleviation protein